MQFDSLDDIRAFCRDLPGGDDWRGRRRRAAGSKHLTKPPGSLGRLEELAIWLARWQRRELPRLERVTIAVFAGNHGVAARGVSAYPPAVTAQMVANFAAGGAAINQIAKLAGAELRVVPIELDRPTRDFTVAPAMDASEFLAAVDDRLSHRAAGLRSARGRRDGHRQHHGGGDAVRGVARRRRGALGRPRHRRRRWRTGAQARGDRCRARSSSRHVSTIRSRSAAALGGRELAAIAGAVLAARAQRDSRAARRLRRDRRRPAAGAPCARHAGSLPRRACLRRDPAIGALLRELGLAPLLDLDMRLGEASGAGVAILLLARRAGLPCRHGDICRSRASQSASD